MKNKPRLKELIIATLATVLGGIILDWIPVTRNFISGILNAIGNFFHGVWSFLISESQFSWAFIIILFLLAIPTVLRIVQVFIPKPKSSEPSVDDYKEDRFYGVLWRWSSLYSPDLAGFCPNCQTRLVAQIEYGYGIGDKTSFYCETCKKKIVTLDDNRVFVLGTVWRQIERKINTGEWKQVVEKNKKPEK